MSITLAIVLITTGISIWAFNDNVIMGKLIFDPIRVTNQKQYYRFITSGFVHSDYMHLAFNMLSFYSFGENLEKYILSDVCVFNQSGPIVFIVLYLLAIIVSEIPSYIKHKTDSHYLSLGASGGVSAIIFATVLFFPQLKLGLFFIPLPIPGYIFCFLFLLISSYLDKNYGSRINHSAHIFGALFGIAFIFAAAQIIGNINVIDNFMQQVRMPLNTILPFECK